MLSDRRQRVLQALIKEYIANAQPVGSRTLVDRYQLGVSPATVRNELSALEDEGYLVSPHTSAGRIPTDVGYRAFVDDLLKSEFGDATQGSVFDEIREAATKIDDLMEQTSAALARLTGCLSVVMSPSLLRTPVKQVSLVPFSARRVLMVVVTMDGQVLDRTMDLAEDVSSDDVADVQSALNEVLSGRAVADIHSAGAAELSATMASPLARTVVDELVACLGKADAGRAHQLGLSTLLAKPEFRQVDAALPILQVFEDETVLMQLFDNVAAGMNPVEVRIGRENWPVQLSGVSVVAAQYGASSDAQGIVAVIGPTRMDYSQVIGAVRAAKAALGSL